MNNHFPLKSGKQIYCNEKSQFTWTGLTGFWGGFEARLANLSFSSLKIENKISRMLTALFVAFKTFSQEKNMEKWIIYLKVEFDILLLQFSTK